jgi:protein gp37
MAETAIEWTHRDGTVGKTWNPSTGCDRISSGCDNCYALTLAKRLKGMGSAKYQNDGDPRTSGPGFGITAHSDALGDPLKWRKPATVFVNSMSDLFHARVPREFVAQVFATMLLTPQHTYQILTKRPERMQRILSQYGWWTSVVVYALELHEQGLGTMSPTQTRPDGHCALANVWLGTSIESDEHVKRADALRATPAAVRFISAEPLLGPLSSLNLTSIDWLIAGGESGPGSRPMDLDLVRDLIDRCRESGTAPFVKQLGSLQTNGPKDKKGGDWSTWPADLRVREYPVVAEAVSAR